MQRYASPKGLGRPAAAQGPLFQGRDLSNSILDDLDEPNMNVRGNRSNLPRGFWTAAYVGYAGDAIHFRLRYKPIMCGKPQRIPVSPSIGWVGFS